MESQFVLDQEMLKELAREFDSLTFVNSLGLTDARDIERAGTSFEKYGRNLAVKSIEEGEKRPDRIYEVMKTAVEKTGEMNFPLIPQRYVEIAYLSIQPIRRLWILSNNYEVFAYRLNECNIYKAIEKEYGEEAAKKMVCKQTCLAIIGETFSHFGFNVETLLEANMVTDGRCQFKIKKK